MKFELGNLVATPGFLAITGDDPLIAQALLYRHGNGDWGGICEEDAQVNENALRDGGRILSSYMIDGHKVWVITEADRSATTLLLPSEYDNKTA